MSRAREAEVGLAVLAAVVLPTLFFHRLLFGPGVFAAVDMVRVHIPFRHFIDLSLRAGELPLWVPQVWLGAPFLANGDAALLYPLQFPLLLLDPARGIAWVIWLHAALSILTMYAFCRISLQARPLAALTAGIVFAFNGYALAHTLYLSAIYLAPWPPLVFLGVERAVRARLGWGWLAPPAVALTVLSGNPQEMFWTGLWLPLFAASLAFTVPRRRWQAFIRGLAVSLASAVLGSLIAAAQLFPQLELVSLGGRGGGGLSYAQATLFPLAKRVAVTLPLPDYLGTFSGENAAWIGLVASLVGLAALLRFERLPAVRLLIGFFIVMAAGSAVLALGPATPVYRAVYALVPGMHLFRFPVRWLYPTSLAAAALVALGADEVADRLPTGGRLAWPVPALIALAVAVLVFLPWVPLAGSWSGHHLLLVASLIPLALAAAALVGAGRGLIDARGAMLVLPLAVAIELLGVSQFMEWNHPYPGDYYAARRPLPAALAGAGPTSAVRLLPLVAAPPWAEALATLAPNTNLLIDRSSVVGNGGNWPAGRNTDLETDVVLPAQTGRPLSPSRLELLKALGVTHLVARRGSPVLAHITGQVTPVATDGEWALYRLHAPGRQAWTSCGAIPVAGPAAALRAVLAPGFRAGALYLEGQVPAAPPRPCGSARITALADDSEQVRVTVPEAAWLVLAASDYPGWEASVDGSGATIYPADYFLRAVRVPAGTHTVQFAYRPESFTAGVAVSVAAAVMWLAGAAVALFGRRPLSASGRSPARGSR